MMSYLPGREFIALPGPTNVPDRVLGAMHRPALDFLAPEFIAINKECLAGLKQVFKTETGAVTAYAATGHGSWEAAMTNTGSPGDLLLIPETGNFSETWRVMAEALGLRTENIPSEWNVAIVPDRVAERLRQDGGHEIKAVCVVHNETSTGVCNDIAAIRAAIDATGHPALLMVDTISSLASMDFRFDDWGIDVAVAGSQKGLMLPVGLGFSVASAKAMRASESAKLPRRFFDWRELSGIDGRMRFAGTAPIHMFFALREGLTMLLEEGLDAVIAPPRAAWRGNPARGQCLVQEQWRYPIRGQPGRTLEFGYRDGDARWGGRRGIPRPRVGGKQGLAGRRSAQAGR